MALSLALSAAVIVGTFSNAVATANEAAGPAVVKPVHRHPVTPRPGPALSPSGEDLRAALRCSNTRGTGAPVLLVHGTSATPFIAWAKGLKPLLIKAGYRVCTVALPAGASGPADVAGEYVTYSIRAMATRFQQPVSVVGHSQGGMLTRWAITWWPDIRSLVGDVIGLSPSNHGAPAVASLCGVTCPASYWQQGPDSRFLAALNRGDETPGRVNYTVLESRTDTTVPPPSPELRGNRQDSNIAVQTLCPGRQVSHTQMIYDAVALAAVFDALTHNGPARLKRIPHALCARTYARGINQSDADNEQQIGNAYAVTNFAMGPLLTAEPALPRYATRPAPHPRAQLVVAQHTDHHGRTRFRAVGTTGSQRWPLPFARITVGGDRVTTDANGRARLRISTRSHPVRVHLLARGLAPTTRTLAPLR